MYTVAKFVKVSNERSILKEENEAFYYLVQRGILLSLKEIGTLNEGQFRLAEKKLKEQYRAGILLDEL